jgi:cellulose/xylan binding protein with CBM9 domain
MTSAPRPFLRPRTLAPCVAVGVSVLGGLGLSGCFFELPELVSDAGIGASGGTAGLPPIGGGGGSGAGGSGGSGAGTGGTDACAGDVKLCGGECVSRREPLTGCGALSCDPCQGPANGNTVMGCSEDGECRVDGCQAGFADCDGDSLGKTSAELTSGNNGCEHSFGTLANGAEPLRVPFQTMSIDGDGAEWNGIPAYPMTKACANCGGDKDPGTDQRPTSASSTPLASDLSGYFRLSWDTSNLYVFAEAFDDQPISSGNYKSEDGLVMMFDGLNDRASDGDFGNDDERVYIGLSKSHEGLTRPLQPGQLVLEAKANGLFCYRIEAQLSWRYIVGFDEQNSQGQLPPAIGKNYGFDISFNDWDRAPGGAEPAVNEHQHQIFWVDPGDAWWRLAQGYGGITLVSDGSSDAGAP